MIQMSTIKLLPNNGTFRNKMWNALVELEEKTRERYFEITAQDPNVARLETIITNKKSNLDSLGSQRNEIRIKIRKKRGVETRLIDQQISEFIIELKELRAEARGERKKARENLKPILKKLDDERKAAVKKIYQNSGLWWGNYNGVFASYNVARSRAMREGARLHFHRFKGSGRFRVLLSGGHNNISLNLLSSAEFSRLIGRNRPIRSKPESRRSLRQCALLKFTIYTVKDENGKIKRRMLELPVILHRSLPGGDAIFKEATLRRDRIGPGQFRWHVTFTFTEPQKKNFHSAPDSTCGINFGWKKVQSGLRIATCFDGKKAFHYILPQEIIETFAYLDKLNSRLSTAINETYAWVDKNIKNSDPPESMQKAFDVLKRAKGPQAKKGDKVQSEKVPLSYNDKFSFFVIKWRDELKFMPKLYREAEKRRKLLKRIELEYKNLSDKIRARREDIYLDVLPRLKHMGFLETPDL